MLNKQQPQVIYKSITICFIFSLLIFGGSSQLKSQFYERVPIQDTIKILWTDEQGKIQLNDFFLRNITESQRAALGYIAIQCGSDCRWAGPKKPDQSNLKCKLTDALNMGYMCSSTQISFLQKWFRNDSASLERLQYCSKKPAEDKVTDKFTEIIFISDPKKYTITYKAKGINYLDLTGWAWEKETVFENIENESLNVIRWQNLNYYRFKL